jgi:hypothetical protein
MAKKNVFNKAYLKLEKQKKPITKWALFVCFMLFAIVASGQLRLLRDQNGKHFIKLPSFFKPNLSNDLVYWESSWTYRPNLMATHSQKLKAQDSLKENKTLFSISHKNAWIRLLSLQSDSNYIEIVLEDSILFRLESNRCKLSPSACLDTLNQLSRALKKDSLLFFKPDSVFNFPEHVLLTSIPKANASKQPQLKISPLYFAFQKELKKVRQLKNPLN